MKAWVREEKKKKERGRRRCSYGFPRPASSILNSPGSRHGPSRGRLEEKKKGGGGGRGWGYLCIGLNYFYFPRVRRILRGAEIADIAQKGERGRGGGETGTKRVLIHFASPYASSTFSVQLRPLKKKGRGRKKGQAESRTCPSLRLVFLHGLLVSLESGGKREGRGKDDDLLSHSCRVLHREKMGGKGRGRSVPALLISSVLSSQSCPRQGFPIAWLMSFGGGKGKKKKDPRSRGTGRSEKEGGGGRRKDER